MVLAVDDDASLDGNARVETLSTQLALSCELRQVFRLFALDVCSEIALVVASYLGIIQPPPAMVM